MASRGLLPDPAAFLARHWQREPLLIRNAIPGFQPPVSAEELAGLAMEAEIESRIVTLHDGAWRLRHGPFTARDFDHPYPWTLLVQGVDQLLPEVAALRTLVYGLPQWRLDDVMVSYASDGGGVGPHYDQYDVFLLQGAGERMWRLGQRCDEDTPLLPHDELKLLADFECQEEYHLQCGDILYVPPGVAHWGVSVGDSTCFSIGFRAPRIADLLSRWTDVSLESLSDSLLLEDRGRAVAERAGEISTADIDNALEQLRKLLIRGGDPLWFGEVITEIDLDAPDKTSVRRSLKRLRRAQTRVRVAAEARVAWQDLGTDLRVFANGQSQRCSRDLREPLTALCAGQTLTVSSILVSGADAGGLLEFLTLMGGLDVD